MLNELTKQIQGLSRQQRVVGVTLAVLISAAVYGFTQYSSPTRGHSDVSSQSRKGGTRYMLTPAEWASVSVQPVIEQKHRLNNESLVSQRILSVASDSLQQRVDFARCRTTDR